MVSETAGTPLYEQIALQFRAAILSGRLQAGDALPSLRKLASDLRVSLITTTRAYNELEAAGLIVNAPGKGSFVAEIDPRAVRVEVLNSIEKDIGHAVSIARDTGVASLTDMHRILNRKWDEYGYHER